MRIPNKAASEYYFLLKSIFPKITYEEARFLKEMKADIIEFSLTHPHCTYDTLVEEFGSPQDVFHEYFYAQDISDILQRIKKTRLQKFIYSFISIVVVIIFIIYYTFTISIKFRTFTHIPGKVVISINEEDI